MRDHRASSAPTLFGRVIYIDKQEGIVVLMRFPKKNKRGHNSNYVLAPRLMSLSSLQRDLKPGGLSIVEYEMPSHWLLTDEQLQANTQAGLLKPSRRNLPQWIKSRDKAYELIKPLVHDRSIKDILLDPTLPGWPTKRAKELNLKGCSQIQRALNAYLLSLGIKNGLLPWYAGCGEPGKAKVSRNKTGRPREFQNPDSPRPDGRNCGEVVREIFILGWAKYKKPGVSVNEAFHKTLLEWFCQSIEWDGTTPKVKLRPDACHYTVEQFEYWGKKGPDALSAKDIEQGETPAKRQYLRRQGKMSDRFQTANGDAFLDSTSCDQSMVSCASRLKNLSSPWRTDVLGASIDYIFGHHVGFESPSQTTALMAILHAAEDKVEYCARYDVKIKPGDWHAMTFRNILMDNGEGKGQLVLKTLEDMECNAMFGAAYDAINKSPLESKHKQTQKALDHRLPGSTQGRRARRGEENRAKLAILHFFEYMPLLIKHVLHHNNKARIVLPTLEMRRDGVEPTRRGVLEWMIHNGYTTSAPRDLADLRVRCLPRLRGSVQADGVHLFDPTFNGNRIIPGLVFTSDWLMRSGLLERAQRRRLHMEVHLNPSCPANAWINLNGLKQLHLKTADPDMHEMTLLDWLSISRDDRLVGYLHRVDATKEGVTLAATIKQVTANAQKEKKAEAKARGKPPSTEELKSGKRMNTAVERTALTGVPHVPKPKKNPPTLPKDEPLTTSSGNPPNAASAYADIIRSLRNREGPR